MCDFPSWRECPDGSILFLTDKHVKKNIILEWDVSLGHTAISKVFPHSKGIDKEGFKECPEEFWNAILAGKCNEMMEHARFLDLRGCDLRGITFPKHINGTLDLRSCNLKGITLPTSIGGSLDLEGCDIRGTMLPIYVGRALYLNRCDLKGIVFPIHVGGRVDVSGCNLEGIKIPESFNVIKYS